MNTDNSISNKKLNLIIESNYSKTNVNTDKIEIEKEKTNENTEINEISNKNYLNRCNYPDCNKKLKLTDIKCRCGFKFCALHRYSDKHNCGFDYKNMGKIELTKQNPVVNFSKFEKIS